MSEDLPRIKEVFIDNNGKRIFTGFLDKQVFEQSEKGYFLHIEARGVASKLIDNEALPECYENISLDRIFDKYIKPYGSFVNNISSRFRAYEIVIGKGKSQWQSFCDSCLIITGRKPYMRKDKYITFGYYDTKYNVDSDIISSKSIYNPSKVVSHVILRDDDGRYTEVYKNNNPNTQHIFRKRYHIAPKEWEDDKSMSVYDVFQKSVEDIYLKEIVLGGFLNFEIGDTIVLNNEKFAVKEVNADFNTNQIKTKIICCPASEFNI